MANNTKSRKKPSLPPFQNWKPGWPGQVLPSVLLATPSAPTAWLLPRDVPKKQGVRLATQNCTTSGLAGQRRALDDTSGPLQNGATSAVDRQPDARCQNARTTDSRASQIRWQGPITSANFMPPSNWCPACRNPP
ncbi:hypothetical protein Vretimale_1534 [Volvox reticuliferus]|uniref:Uncharacterized protein n=1 Tax=Volvox reticuliferus TaxID=1737510 RepID=A0A8J4DA44_9CHLO|nr:hypothetical protein Vretimale_1534 [Volvox reticuliferus]